MNTFIYISLLVACTLSMPVPDEGKRDKRWSDWGLGSSLEYSSYSLDSPLISHAPIVYSAPTTIIHEPAVVSVKKIVSVPRVVSVKRIVSVPHVSRVSRVSHAHYVSAPRVTYSYAPAYSPGWW